MKKFKKVIAITSTLALMLAVTPISTYADESKAESVVTEIGEHESPVMKPFSFSPFPPTTTTGL